jgi:hypothetical protein
MMSVKLTRVGRNDLEVKIFNKGDTRVFLGPDKEVTSRTGALVVPGGNISFPNRKTRRYPRGILTGREIWAVGEFAGAVVVILSFKGTRKNNLRPANRFIARGVNL